MENSNDSSIFNLSITQKLKDDFKTAGTWAVISAIVAFINAAIGLFGNISKGALFTAIFSAGISVLLNIFLLNFGRKIKAGIIGDNQEEVNESLNNLKLYFKVTGIIVIVILAIAILAIIFSLLALGTRG